MGGGGRFRGDLDREFSRSLGVRSFPTVLAFRKAGGKPFVYGSTDRRVEPLLKFANYIFRSELGSRQLEVRAQTRTRPTPERCSERRTSMTHTHDICSNRPSDRCQVLSVNSRG